MFTGCSRGCLKTSETPLLNSGNSSKKRTLLQESDISPGCGYDPPPTRATSYAAISSCLCNRIAIESDEFEGHKFTKDTLLLMPIYELHRHSDFW